MIDRGERLAADCDAFFRGYSPEKSLLHGDLWGGNASALAGGAPVVFDPAVYVGDREADLAMTALFGGFPRDFHAAYQAAWPLDDGYHRVRRDFYMLYHVLNHANLFAGAYVRQAEESIERSLAELR
jgi:fructosamine-3-kinase